MLRWVSKLLGLRGQNAQTGHLVVLIEEEIFCPVSYVRIVNHLQHAPPGWSAEILVLPREATGALERLEHASVLLMARCVSGEAFTIAKEAQKRKLPIVYDIDDYLWRLPDYLVGSEKPSDIDGIIAAASLVTTPSTQLVKFIGDRFPNVRVELIPNAADLPLPAMPERNITAIMGNSDFFRLKGEKQALFEAMREAARYTNSRLWLYYLSNDPPEYCTDDPALQVIWCGVRSYTSYRALIDRVRPNVAIVALPDDHFSRYKSVIKFAEFGAYGVPGIYSNVEPYKGFVREGSDGWLSGNSPSEWREAFCRVFSLSDVEIRGVGERAQERAAIEFSAPIVRQRFFSAIQSVGMKVASGNAPLPHTVPPPQNFTFRESYDYVVDVWRNSPHYRKA